MRGTNAALPKRRRMQSKAIHNFPDLIIHLPSALTNAISIFFLQSLFMSLVNLTVALPPSIFSSPHVILPHSPLYKVIRFLLLFRRGRVEPFRLFFKLPIHVIRHIFRRIDEITIGHGISKSLGNAQRRIHTWRNTFYRVAIAFRVYFKNGSLFVQAMYVHQIRNIFFSWTD